MRVLPYDQFTVSTILPPDEVVLRLKNCVQQSSFLPMKPDFNKPFIGTVNDADFCLHSRPVIPLIPKLEAHGIVCITDQNTEIRVQLCPSSMLLIVLQGVFCMLSVLLFEDSVQVFALVAMLVLMAWFLLLLPFWLDGGRLHRHLKSTCNSMPSS